MNECRFYHSALLLPGGMVMEAAGYATTTAELYDPSRSDHRCSTKTKTAVVTAVRETSPFRISAEEAKPPLPRRFCFSAPACTQIATRRPAGTRLRGCRSYWLTVRFTAVPATPPTVTTTGCTPGGAVSGTVKLSWDTPTN